jgi:hypothetical protein
MVPVTATTQSKTSALRLRTRPKPIAVLRTSRIRGPSRPGVRAFPLPRARASFLLAWSRTKASPAARNKVIKSIAKRPPLRGFSRGGQGCKSFPVLRCSRGVHGSARLGGSHRRKARPWGHGRYNKPRLGGATLHRYLRERFEPSVVHGRSVKGPLSIAERGKERLARIAM